MIRAVVAGALVLLAACDQLSGGNATERASAARDFPRADRPIAPIVHQCSDAVACAFCSAVRSMQILMDMELGRTEQKRAA